MSATNRQIISNTPFSGQRNYHLQLRSFHSSPFSLPYLRSFNSTRLIFFGPYLFCPFLNNKNSHPDLTSHHLFVNYFVLTNPIRNQPLGLSNRLPPPQSRIALIHPFEPDLRNSKEAKLNSPTGRNNSKASARALRHRPNPSFKQLTSRTAQHRHSSNLASPQH